MPFRRWGFGCLILWMGMTLLVGTPARALEPEEIALVINARVPDSRALAVFYAQQRHIPDDRIIELDLDPGNVRSPAEEMRFDDYEPRVAAPVRNFLDDRHLRGHVKCLVTFWGMPLRIARRTLTDPEKTAFAAAQSELFGARSKIAEQVTALENIAARLDPSFKPDAGESLGKLSKRMDRVLPKIVQSLTSVTNESSRNADFSQVLGIARLLLGDDRTTLVMSQPAAVRLTTRPSTSAELADAQSRLDAVQKQIGPLQAGTGEVADFDKARSLARDGSGLFGLAYMAAAQINRLGTDQSESALDSELALVWWPPYPRARWVDNPLQWQNARRLHENYIAAPDTLMVTRLDGPSIEVVRNIITTSLMVEADGLGGQAALDARGKTGADPYAQYDQTIRNLAGLLRKKTSLTVTLDDKESLIPAHSLSDIGLYCGWYSLRNFSSPGSFAPGAVGYHVASFELLSLREPHEHGWVRGLLSEGVIATLGPVSEPYLQSFPPADEFFPLLLTGKLTLAEVYWRTAPWASWMQTCIGDPLYTPFKHHPRLDPGALPESVRDAIGLSPGSASTHPTSNPN